MTYCRRCGTRLEEEACFCHKCGTQVITITHNPPPSSPNPTAYTYQPPPTTISSPRKDPWVLIAVGLLVILVLAATIVIFLVAPLGYWNISNQYGSNVNKLDFNFEGNINKINSTPSQTPLQFEVLENNAVCVGNGLATNTAFNNQSINR